VPRLASSSSATRARITPPTSSRAICSAATTNPAIPPFMSAAPRPYLRWPLILGSNGADIWSTPTVSRCPLSKIVGPVVLGFQASRLGRSGWPAGVTTRVEKPDRSSRSRNIATMAVSPAAPGTSPGLTESIATSSASRLTGSAVIDTVAP